MRWGLIMASGLALFPLIILDVVIGAYRVNPIVALKAIIDGIDPVFGVPHDTYLVIWQIRLPETLASLLLGASLASAGAMLQGILRNPLASTYTLGVSAAAGFGAAVAILLGAGYVVRYYLPVITEPYLVIIGAFIAASIAALLVYFLSFIKGASPVTIILAGVAVMFVFSTGTSLIQYFSGNPDVSHAIVMWMLGSVTNVTLNYIPYMSLSLLAIPYYVLISWRLNALNLGDDVAHSLGVNVRNTRLAVMLVTAFQAAAVISFVGLVGFIDLVIPNIMRILIGNDNRYLVPASALMGADVAVLADVVSKALVPPYVIPIGVVLSMIGAPYLLAIVISRGTQYGYE
ncbi:transport system permease protein [Vulcanisaeta distributa DSM 14429]|uniref:Transport system permease protein n=2 Tax=Vulcanisaeta distributa TaxID=164451 RepID=E1QNJ0_VULDI|nr:transport system permease protein [Vulcanisaeta distributa DSM 14429]